MGPRVPRPGTPFEFCCEDQPDQYAAKEAVRRAVTWATSQGVVSAAAAGNSAHDLADTSSFANRGLGVIDVAAPGSSILSTVPRTTAASGYGLLSGTSMASPHVAGVLALMKSAHPTWTPAQLIDQLRPEADDKACTTTPGVPACTGTAANNGYFGEGVVDALDAVA
jgi:subtilisin family serine protease